MTAYTNYDAPSGGALIAASSGGNYAGAPAQTILTGVFDASKRALAAADTAKVVTIPAGTHVQQVFAEVLTVDDATHVFNVGDDTDPDGYVAGAAADALAVVQGGGAYVDATAAGVGKFYAAADTIDVEAATGDALDTLKVRIIVVCTIVG
jgi:hypothetical protein